MNRIALALIGAFGLGLASGGALAEDTELNVYNWTDYIGETTIADFEKETGIKVRYDVFDSYETLDGKMLAGDTGYDIIFPGRTLITHHVKAGMYLPIDKSKLTNMANIDDKFWKALSVADPGNKHSVPYMYWTNGFVYDAKKVQEIMPDAPVDSWDMIFKPEIISKFADCGVSVLDSPEDVMELALNYLGIDTSTTKQEDLAKAADLIIAIKPYLQKFDSVGTIDALAAGDRCLALTWSGDFAQARNGAIENGIDVDLRFSAPKEGVNLDYDALAIPVDAPHPEAAHKFIDFMMRPDVIAAATNYIGYANANKEATAMVLPEIRENPALYPDPSRLARVYTSDVRDADGIRVLTSEWNRAKSE
jgi:putrescine transport system substrate-binding protein